MKAKTKEITLTAYCVDVRSGGGRGVEVTLETSAADMLTELVEKFSVREITKALYYADSITAREIVSSLIAHLEECECEETQC